MSFYRIVKQLRESRNEKAFGAMSSKELEAGRRALLQSIGAEDISRPKYGVRDYFEYAGSMFSHAIARPALVGLGVLVLVAGGSLTSVSAAYDSVPGDVLYPIKIVSEQARLTIATSDVKRAELHVQFASRRLDEMKTISNSTHEDKNERMKTVVEAFTNEVGEAKTAMQTIASNGTDASSVANAINAQAEEFETVIKSTASEVAESEDSVVEQVVSAQQGVSEAENAAVEVLVNAVETTPESPVAEDLQKKFRKELQNLDERSKMTLGRIQVIKNVLSGDSTLKLTLTEWVGVDEIATTLKGFDGDIHDAMNIMAAGGYRTAFERLDVIEATIDRADAEVANMELSIVAQRSASLVPTVSTPEPEEVIQDDGNSSEEIPVE